MNFDCSTGKSFCLATKIVAWHQHPAKLIMQSKIVHVAAQNRMILTASSVCSVLLCRELEIKKPINDTSWLILVQALSTNRIRGPSPSVPLNNTNVLTSKIGRCPYKHMKSSSERFLLYCTQKRLVNNDTATG